MGRMKLSQGPGATKLALGLLVLGLLLRGGFAQQPGARTPMETWDDRLLRVEKRALGFGGMFTGEDGRLVVYLLDPSQIATARAAIEAVFGASQVPAAGMRALRGQYTVSQLKRWSQRGNKLLEMQGITMVDLDEGRNRVTIGVDKESRVAAVAKALPSLGIPPEAVVVEVKGRIVLLEHAASKKSSK
jgi:sulfur carrier protein ThiS